MRTAIQRLALVGALLAVVSTAGVAAAAAASSPTASGPTTVFVSDMAQSLGVSQGRLTAAIQSAELARVQALEQSGKVSVTRAKTLTAWIERNPLAALSVSLNVRSLATAQTRRVEARAAAKFLGITVKALRADQSHGQSLDAVAASQGKTASDLLAAMLAPIQAHLAKAVSTGGLTAAQEQTALTRAQAIAQAFASKS